MGESTMVFTVLSQDHSQISDGVMGSIVLVSSSAIQLLSEDEKSSESAKNWFVQEGKFSRGLRKWSSNSWSFCCWTGCRGWYEYGAGDPIVSKFWGKLKRLNFCRVIFFLQGDFFGNFSTIKYYLYIFPGICFCNLCQ